MVKKVFEIFVENGAPKEILYLQKPHIGTDLLRDVVVNIRKSIERCGREVIAPCEVDYRLLLKGNCIGCLTAMYDSALTGKIFFKEIGHEDYVCWLSILKQGYKAQNTNTVTALYRVSDHSVSSNKLKAMRWQWNILRNEMDLPVYKAVYYFIHYAIRAFAKAMR